MQILINTKTINLIFILCHLQLRLKNSTRIPQMLGLFRFWSGPGTCNFIEKMKGHALHHPNPGLSQFNANNNPPGGGGSHVE